MELLYCLFLRVRASLVCSGNFVGITVHFVVLPRRVDDSHGTIIVRVELLPRVRSLRVLPLDFKQFCEWPRASFIVLALLTERPRTPRLRISARLKRKVGTLFSFTP